jgi:hypothetical protein
MIDELIRGVRFLERITKIPNENKKRTAKFIGDLELCAVKYKQALRKNNKSTMRQISAEFEEIMHAFRNRMFVVIDQTQDEKLREAMKRTVYLEHTLDDVAEELVSTENLTETLHPAFERVRAKATLLQELDILVGQLRGLRKTLTAT